MTQHQTCIHDIVPLNYMCFDYCYIDQYIYPFLLKLFIHFYYFRIVGPKKSDITVYEQGTNSTGILYRFSQNEAMNSPLSHGELKSSLLLFFIWASEPVLEVFFSKLKKIGLGFSEFSLSKTFIELIFYFISFSCMAFNSDHRS